MLTSIFFSNISIRWMCLDRFIKYICSMSLYISVYTACRWPNCEKKLLFNAFLVQSSEPSLDETLITSLGNEVSLHVDLGAVWSNQV